jgi:ATP-dependent Clp protease adapter protein ClpS
MIKYQKGQIEIKTIIGFPIVVELAFFYSGLFFMFIFSSSIPEAIYIFIGYTLIIVLHELGHAISDRCFGNNVKCIKLNILGGFCLSERPKNRSEAFVCVSSGLVVQMILFFATVGYIHFNGAPTSKIGESFGKSFIFINVILFFWNIFPRKNRKENFGTDGYILWKIIIQYLRKQPFVYPDTSVTFSPKTSLLSNNELMQVGFKVGIEIFNDNTTSMEFVVNALIKHLKITEEESIKMMAAIHKKGGLLIPLESYTVAEKISSSICNDAKEKGFSLLCRPVEASQKYSCINE